MRGLLYGRGKIGVNAERSGTAIGKEEIRLSPKQDVRFGSPERKNQDDGPKSDAHDGTI
jgi:hypothetical protein